MNRREFLASGAALSLAVAGGCTGCAASVNASLSMEAVTDAEIGERVTSGYHIEESNPRYDVVTDTVANGTATPNGTEPPLANGTSVAYDGSVYELRYEIIESRPATRFTITLNPVDGDPDPAEVVEYDALPEVDRRTFEERGFDGDFLGFVTGLLYLDSELPESALVPEPERSVIEWPDGTRGRFSVDGSAERPLETYRYTATTLYESTVDLGATVRERYAFALTGLSDAERAIVEEAAGGEYLVPPDEEPPGAMRRLAARFRPLRGDPHAPGARGDDRGYPGRRSCARDVPRPLRGVGVLDGAAHPGADDSRGLTGRLDRDGGPARVRGPGVGLHTSDLRDPRATTQQE